MKFFKRFLMVFVCASLSGIARGVTTCSDPFKLDKVTGRCEYCPLIDGTYCSETCGASGGQYWDEKNSTCVKNCEVGVKINADGTYACNTAEDLEKITSCGGSTFWNVKKGTCEPKGCAAGQYWAGGVGQASCIPCPENQEPFASAPGSVADGCQCKAGYASNGAGGCILKPCEKNGYVRNPITGVCALVPCPGKPAQVPNRTRTGMVNLLLTDGQCFTEEAAPAQGQTQDVCSSLPGGWVLGVNDSLGGYKECVFAPCPAGTQRVDPSINLCCNPGEFLQKKLTPLAPGEAEYICAKCPTGYVEVAGKCCFPGQVNVGGTCVSCMRGISLPAPKNDGCTCLNPAQYFNLTSKQCEFCPAGQVPSGDRYSCVCAGLSTYDAASNTCVCPVGQVFDPTEVLKCKNICPLNATYVKDKPAAQQCVCLPAFPTTGSSTGSTVKFPHYYDPVKNMCVPCSDIEQIVAADGLSCVCPNGKEFIMDEIVGKRCQCPADRPLFNTITSTCVACPKGATWDRIGSKCICPTGTSDMGGICCAAGQYNLNGVCTACASPKILSTDGKSCVCPADKPNDRSVGGSPLCCTSVNQYNNNGVCTACPSGTGNTGSVNPTNNTECRCVSTRYKWNSGSKTCESSSGA